MGKITNAIYAQPEPLLSHTCLLGESPLWNPVTQEICWVDIIRGELHRYAQKTKLHQVTGVGQMLGAIGLAKNSLFIAALQHGFGFINADAGTVTMIHDPEEQFPGNRFNEGKCAPDGRFWAGTMAFDEAAGAGNVYCLHHDFSVTKQITQVTISNGMAWSTDHATLYYIDSPARAVVAYDYDTVTGTISGKRMVIDLHSESGFPDGMTIDEEGMLWIAFWGGWKIARWDPQQGKKIAEIGLPVANVSSCTFGGPSLDNLFITTAGKDITSEDLRKQPLAGSIFVLPNCGYRGVPGFYFKPQ